MIIINTVLMYTAFTIVITLPSHATSFEAVAAQVLSPHAIDRDDSPTY